VSILYESLHFKFNIMMKKMEFTLLLTLLTASSLLAQKADDILGKYKLPNGMEIELIKDENTYSGKIISLDDYEKNVTKDIKNPDKAKRNDDLLGKTIITDLVFSESDKKWLNGKLYGPEKGITINLKITKMTKTKATAVGSKFLLWRTFDWVKI